MVSHSLKPRCRFFSHTTANRLQGPWTASRRRGPASQHGPDRSLPGDWRLTLLTVPGYAISVRLSQFSGPFGVVLGWVLAIITRPFDVVWFGAKLGVECKNVPGNKDETPDGIFIKFRVQNSTKRRVAKSCRAYLVELHKISNNKVISENLIPDTFQLPWAGHDFEPRDIPYKVNQYVDLVRFSKHAEGWNFLTKPPLYSSLATLAGHRGTYRFTVVVARRWRNPSSEAGLHRLQRRLARCHTALRVVIQHDAQCCAILIGGSRPTGLSSTTPLAAGTQPGKRPPAG